jgi:tRNA pseudouridine55 synthase
MTSARAVSRIKRLLPKQTRIGHTGTLDPLASGLLVLLIGRSTRLSRYVTDLNKTYTATARFGAVSDTLDAEGGITAIDAPFPARAAIYAALPAFTGDLLQIPPMASALKRDGTRLYELHRKGISVEREPRPITVQELNLTDLDPAGQTATFELSCSSGTYVRTLIADLATYLGSGAYLTALRRTSVGHLHIGNASLPENLDQETLYNHIIPATELLSHLPGVDVAGGEGRRLVCHGRPTEGRGFDGSYRVMCGEELLAVYRDRGDEGRAEVVLCAG